MSTLPEAAKAYIGVEAEEQVASECVERGAVRRYAQAIMDEDPIYSKTCEANVRYGGPVAPLIFPFHMFYWRSFGVPDPVQANAHDPGFDGVAGMTGGPPEIEALKNFSAMNGGSEFEFYRYARHGETVKLRSRYVDIVEKETNKGPYIFVITENEYRNGEDELLLRVRRTQIRRKL